MAMNSQGYVSVAGRWRKARDPRGRPYYRQTDLLGLEEIRPDG
jgi:hypothetical protein